jgi:predicted transcriptional regulator with HTH domain
MKISQEKIDKISEQILYLLYSINPKSLFTSYIAKEIARDEEFVKKILLNLKLTKLVVEIKKNFKGDTYLRRSRWKISNIAYQIYQDHQTSKLSP